MSTFVRLDGTITDQNDPLRSVWYSTSFHACGLWTDDWDLIAEIDGLPRCRFCYSVGFIIDFRSWEESAIAHEKAQHARYHEFVTWHKNRCGSESDTSWQERFWMFLEDPASIRQMLDADKRRAVDQICDEINRGGDV